MHRYVLALLILAIFSLSLPLPARADTALDADWNSAYVAVMKNPASAELNQRYYGLCVARGDYEAAIAPLERMLAKKSDDAALMFKLGEAYQKLQSASAARVYFKQVVSSNTAGADLKAKATAALSAVEE